MFKINKQVAPIIDEVSTAKDLIIEEKAYLDLQGLVDSEILNKHIKEEQRLQKEADDLRKKLDTEILIKLKTEKEL
jgi:hypothetical protein